MRPAPRAWAPRCGRPSSLSRHPQGGTPFIECAQTVGIDLPLKALVWEDGESRVWLGYNDPAFVAERHGAEDCAVVENLQRAFASLAAAATAP